MLYNILSYKDPNEGMVMAVPSNSTFNLEAKTTMKQTTAAATVGNELSRAQRREHLRAFAAYRAQCESIPASLPDAERNALRFSYDEAYALYAKRAGLRF